MKNYELNKKALKNLRLAHSKSKRGNSPIASDKIKAVYLLGSGWRIKDVMEALLIDETTARHYFNTYKQNGLDGLLETNYRGSAGFLSDNEESELDEHLESHPCMNTQEVIAHVESEYEITYSISGMNNLLKRLGYSYKKARQVPGKADRAAQAEFTKEYYKIRRKMTEDDSLFFLDGVHPQHNSIPSYGWFKKGKDEPLCSNTRYLRLNINGAYDIDRHEVVTQFSSTINKESTLDLLEKLRKARPFGRIYCVLDNAGYYISQDVKDFAKACAIELIYLPAYSPNLNIIERLWRFMNKKIFYNKYYKEFDEFKSTCKSFFKMLPQYKEELKKLMTEKFETLPAI